MTWIRLRETAQRGKRREGAAQQGDGAVKRPPTVSTQDEGVVSAWVVAVLVSEDKEKTVEALRLLECLLRNVTLHLNPHFLLTKLVT